MKIRNYQLKGILEQCKERGLKTIDEILKELKQFNDMHIVVETTNKNKDTK